MGLFDLFKKREQPDVDPAEIQRHVRQLSAADPKARIAACQALGRLGAAAQPAVPALQALIDDDDGDVCNAAAAALSDIDRHHR